MFCLEMALPVNQLHVEREECLMCWTAYRESGRMSEVAVVLNQNAFQYIRKVAEDAKMKLIQAATSKKLVLENCKNNIQPMAREAGPRNVLRMHGCLRLESFTKLSEKVRKVPLSMIDVILARFPTVDSDTRVKRQSSKPGSTNTLCNCTLNVTLLSMVRPVSICGVELLLWTSDPMGEVVQGEKVVTPQAKQTHPKGEPAQQRMQTPALQQPAQSAAAQTKSIV
ncbi:hypothetical protein llap_8808 [Limosa lapponica baueri]|uniref:Uncharacterized protein n=1 Tax=Limosa lapponica baueri TaxID=1758121 RepID=A0A2I0U4C5_LIMLA|nr:hypothetical protein llap_8808 [Limosa lapponica baueri]